MTYLICKNDIKKQEVEERRKYIYDVFHIYTFVDTKSSNENLIVLRSMPSTEIDLFLIIGHNKATDNYLNEHYKEIRENNVLIIACCTKYFSSIRLLKNKKVYTSKNGEIIKTYFGEDYGFKFDITDEEILLYRKRKMSSEQLVDKIFRRN